MSRQLLSMAMEERVAVSFRHKGRDYSVEPYSLGYNEHLTKTAGPLVLRAWCLSENTWRDFEVKYMSQIQVTSNRFAGDRPGHTDLLSVLSSI